MFAWKDENKLNLAHLTKKNNVHKETEDLSRLQTTGIIGVEG